METRLVGNGNVSRRRDTVGYLRAVMEHRRGSDSDSMSFFGQCRVVQLEKEAKSHIERVG